ncbi:hypothetical protein PIB30_067241 [Stylosanthes scabra]|uniref:Uncharacterized protein n=1 Tax=Stylosanthes scabra TaxID=79078 RepID=A0ABU6YQ65_9FABA|nr:hypothetical protein [Stylosanthes scabra]
MRVVYQSCVSHSIVDYLDRFSFFFIYGKFGSLKNHKKKFPWCKITKFGGADLGGSSKYSNENFEGRRGERFHVNGTCTCATSYAPALVRRQMGSLQFILMTHGLSDMEFTPGCQRSRRMIFEPGFSV